MGASRRATVCHEVAWLQERHDWPGLAAIGKIEATRETARKTKNEIRYYIMSAPPERFQHVARPHWAIENEQRHYTIRRSTAVSAGLSVSFAPSV